MEKSKTLSLLAIATYLLFQDLCAKNLGVFGTLFPMEENNLIEVIQARLAKLQQEGTLDMHQRNIQQKIQKQVERPTPVEGIIHTVEPRTFTFDPSITVTSDLKDHQGKIFYHKGERVNPLKLRELTKPLLFIEANIFCEISTSTNRHGAIFKFWNFADWIERWICHQIRRGFIVSKRHKHSALRRAVIASHMQSHMTSARCDGDDVASIQFQFF